MVAQKQVELLTRSIDEWNWWLQRRPETRPNLKNANLNGAKLRGVDLRRADLNGADLRNVDLCGAYLRGADLDGADLRHADLSNADLIRAKLNNVHLYGANLIDAKLIGVKLSGAQLYGANLTGVNLSNTKLYDVNLNLTSLNGADLHNTDLSNMTLIHASLNGVNLSSTNLRGADLSHADLTDANLRSADLRDAQLYGTNLRSANFTNTCFGNTFFVKVDLSHVKGLEIAIHNSPSIVDINSVTLPIAEQTRTHFLRGIGFSDTAIEHLPSVLTPTAIHYYSLFIAYANPDEALARRLYKDLQDNGVRCWMAPHDLRPGDYHHSRIDEAIHLHEKVLLLLSEHAVSSPWVKHEVQIALAREIAQDCTILFPLRLDQAVLQTNQDWAARLRETRHIGDFTGWQNDDAYQETFSTLLRHLKVAKPPTASS